MHLGVQREQRRRDIRSRLSEREVPPKCACGAHADIADVVGHLGQEWRVLAHSWTGRDFAVGQPRADDEPSALQPEHPQLLDGAKRHQLLGSQQAQIHRGQELRAAMDGCRPVRHRCQGSRQVNCAFVVEGGHAHG